MAEVDLAVGYATGERYPVSAGRASLATAATRNRRPSDGALLGKTLTLALPLVVSDEPIDSAVEAPSVEISGMSPRPDSSGI
jgi:hypothetical protein